MNLSRPDSYWQGLLGEHRKLSTELTTVEFKSNLADPKEIGQYISALSNAAALYNEPRRAAEYRLKCGCFNPLPSVDEPQARLRDSGRF